jgi:hypothetical protein
MVNSIVLLSDLNALRASLEALVRKDQPEQLGFDDAGSHGRRAKLDEMIEGIQRQFRKRAIIQASLMSNITLPGRGVHEVVMPGMAHQ